MELIEKHWKLMAGGFLALVIIGLGVMGAMYLGQSKELSAQEEYFLVEKNYLSNLAEKKDTDGDKSALENLITKYPKTKAAQMSALYLSELYTKENNLDAALTVLQKYQNNSSGLVGVLVQQKTGQILADLGKCDEAIKGWQKIIDQKSASFLHSEVKLQQALCYRKNNDLKKAEEILTNVANQKLDINDRSGEVIIRTAEKYLRLLQVQKASGS